MKTKAEFDAWVDGWMVEVNNRKQAYMAAGLDAEDAEERAVNEVRWEIRRERLGPPAP